MGIVSAVGDSLYEAFSMFWETLWALVLGFGLSGAVQAFVSRGQMQAALGDHRAAVVGRASFLGMVSSSCSYAAAALAKSLFACGADFTTSMVFMFASTNLVLELGIVLWLLIGWPFALAEFIGGALMIALLALILPRVIPLQWLEDARIRLGTGSEDDGHPHHGTSEDEPEPERRTVRARMRSRAGWSDAAGHTISDLTMLRKELVIGFLVAGFATVLVPNRVVEVAVSDGARILVVAGERAARTIFGDPGVRLLDWERAAGRGAVGGRDQLRWGDLVRVRRPDHAAAAADLPGSTTADGWL